jgi:hypothetical protein
MSVEVSAFMINRRWYSLISMW